MRFKVIVLISLLAVSIGLMGAGFSEETTQVIQAREAITKGYLSNDDVEVMVKELSLDLLQLPYGDQTVYHMNDLVMLGLVDYSDNKYDMARRAQLTDGIQVAASIFAYVPKEGGGYSHPYTNIPAELSDKVGFLYGKGILSDTSNNQLALREPLAGQTYVDMVLKGLGYLPGVDYTAETLESFARSKGLETYGLGFGTYAYGNLISCSWSALDQKPENKNLRLRDQLVAEGVLTKEKSDLLETFFFQRAFPVYRDLTSEVMWKYNRTYDFVYFSNFRSGPAPMSKSYAWPDQPDLELDYAGRIRIDKKATTLDPHEILRQILKDLEVKDYFINKCIEGLTTKGEYEFFKYLECVYDIYETPDYIHMGIYLEFE